MSSLPKFLAATLIALVSFGAAAQSSVARPPQYVVMAFDGGQDDARWDDTIGFARQAKQEGIDVKFTVFLSGIFLVPEAKRTVYNSPAFPPCKTSCSGDCPRLCHKPGQASVDFGGSVDEVRSRILHINTFLADGHELGSHANGHFDGSGWSESEWTSEFDFFRRALFDNARLNGINDPSFPRVNLASAQLYGFRAPFLATSPGMNPALAKAGYEYDASNDNDPSYWPRKNSFGVWNLPLANLRVPNTGRKVLSMDYNFFVMDGGDKQEASLDTATAQRLEDQMYDTYVSYFRSNYLGNRAPVQIGHHFTPYMKGVYWRALKRVARAVCGQPEVRCSTFHELVGFLNGVDDETRAAYSAQRFPRYDGSLASLPQITPGRANASVSRGLQKQKRADRRLADPPSAHDERRH